MSSSLYRFGAQWRLTVRSHHRCLFFKFFLSPPPLPKYKRTFNTRTNPAPLLLSGAGHVDVFNDVDGGGVDDYCSFVFGLLLFYFNSFSFFFYIKDSLVQSSLEQRERKKEGEKKQERLLRAHVHSRNHKQKKSLPLTRFLVAFDAPVLLVQKKKPHTETHTHARTDAGVGVRLVPVSWLYLTEHFSFFLSQWHTVVLFFYFNFIVLVLSVFNTSDFPFKTLIIVLRCWVLDSNYSGCCCYIISFRVDFIWHYFVLHCCNLHWFKCVLSEL